MALRSSDLSKSPAPRLQRDGLGWQFLPAQAPVSFGFSRFAERSSETTAELHVQRLSGDGREHVLRRRVNLLGSRTLSDLARDLESATEGAGFPWKQIVEQAFASVLEAHREGDDVMLLGGRQVAPPRPEHLIDGLLLANTANTWFGPGGTGKSTAAAAACVAVKYGLPFAGRDSRQVEPLYLDYEDEAEPFERILWEVSRGYGMQESARVHWRRMKAPIAQEIAYVAALIDRLRIGLVVIDSATRAMGAAGDHGTYESTAVAFAEAIRALGKCTTLILDHVDGQAVKDGGVSKKSYGSIHKMNFVRNAWSLTPDEQADSQTVGWTHAKVNWIEKERVPFGVRYERDPVMGGLELVKVDGASVRVVAQSMRTVDRIEALLRERGVMAVRDIADEVLESTDRAAIDRVRRALENNKRIFREYSDKTWSLVNWQPARRPDDRPAMRIINPSGDYEDLPWT